MALQAAVARCCCSVNASARNSGEGFRRVVIFLFVLLVMVHRRREVYSLNRVSIIGGQDHFVVVSNFGDADRRQPTSRKRVLRWGKNVRLTESLNEKLLS